MKMHYITEGAGRDILLLHGWGSSAAAYTGVIAALRDKCRLTALDFPGCGESDLPEKPLTVDDYVSMVEKFISVIGLNNPHLVGHSHGCRVIMKICGTRRYCPEKIVFIDGAGIKPKKCFRKSLKIASFKTVKRLPTLPIVKDHSENVLEKARSHFGSADYKSAPEVMRRTMVNLLNEDMTPYISKISSSTLLIWGESDTATPLYMAKKIKSLISDCGLCVIKNTGHWSFTENPVQAHAILRSFLP